MATPYDNASVISMDIPLFIRVLEISRESIKDDAALHHLVERCIKAQTSKDDAPLTMDDYDLIDEGSEPESKDADDAVTPEDESTEEREESSTNVLSSVLSRLSLHE